MTGTRVRRAKKSSLKHKTHVQFWPLRSVMRDNNKTWDERKKTERQCSMFQLFIAFRIFFSPNIRYHIFLLLLWLIIFLRVYSKYYINQRPAAKCPVGGLHYTKHDDLTEFIHRIGCNSIFFEYTQFTTIIVHELEWIMISTSIVIKVKIWTSVWCCSSNKSTLNHNYSFRFAFYRRLLLLYLKFQHTIS